MSRAGTRILKPEDYLTPEERAQRAKLKRAEAGARGLTPDWFVRRKKDLCLPPGMRVAVIGGGFAGIAAAWYLNECGVHTTVYEAGERVGGRVKTDRSFVPKKVVEVGAELIGENHALWGILSSRFKLPLQELTDDDAYEDANMQARLRFGTKVVTKAEKDTLRSGLKQPLLAIGKAARAISETHPWRADGASALDSISVEDGLGRLLGGSPGFVLAMAWLRFTLSNDNCAALKDQSYLGLLASVSAARMGADDRGMLGYWMSTETHRCIGGNDLLAERIGQSLPDLRVRATVSDVTIQARELRPVTITSAVRDSKNAVSQPRRDEFDFAILTVPPTVWNAISVTPPFNPVQRALQQGPAVKFLSRYDSKFWKDKGLAPAAKWDELGSVWEGTDNQGDDPNFDLTVFSGGPLVLPEAQYPSRMKSLYPTGKSKSQLFVDWGAVPFIQTSYAIPAVGQVTSISPRQLDPHEQRLYFAGEQTSSGFFGYMEGALQSGARAARDIIVLMARPCSKDGSGYAGEGGASGGGGSSDPL
jgi:monoamine oxidase